MKKDSLENLRLEMKYRPVAELVPYARNARTHSKEQVAKLAGAIKEFGFISPIIVDGENGILAGHGRVMACDLIGLKEAPTIEAAHLTEAQKRAFILADNRLSEDAGWDSELLKVELAELQDEGFDLTFTGFDLNEITSLLDPDDPYYSRKIESPVYEPTGDRPKLEELCDRTKANALMGAINDADLPADVTDFLCWAAERHVRFRFDRIADYYAHAPAKVQRLMEDSALVIIDFDKAIEDGFVKLTKRMGDLVAAQEGED